MEIDPAKQYVIEDIYRLDHFHHLKKYLVGEVVSFEYGRTNRQIGDDFVYGELRFDRDVKTPLVDFGKDAVYVFFGVKVREHGYE